MRHLSHKAQDDYSNKRLDGVRKIQSWQHHVGRAQGRSEQAPQKPNIEPQFCAVINSRKAPDQRRWHYLGLLIRAGR